MRPALGLPRTPWVSAPARAAGPAAPRTGPATGQPPPACPGGKAARVREIMTASAASSRVTGRRCRRTCSNSDRRTGSISVATASHSAPSTCRDYHQQRLLIFETGCPMMGIPVGPAERHHHRRNGSERLTMAEQIVIVGAGLAGAKAAETLRSEGFCRWCPRWSAPKRTARHERPPLS